MSRSPETYPVYLKVQPRVHEVQDVLRTLNSIFDKNPAVEVSIKGVGVDEHIVRLFVELIVPISDRDPRGVAALHCAQSIFENLFAHLPSYCPAPNALEVSLAKKFLGVNTPPQHEDIQMDAMELTSTESLVIIS